MSKRLSATGFDITLPARLGMLFGGFFNTFGWLFFSAGMVFVLIFGAQADLTAYRFYGNIATAQGELIRVETTQATEDDQRIYAYHYRFLTPREDEYRGVSYALHQGLERGESLTIEYVPENPLISRIEGMRGNVFPIWALGFVSIFPFIGGLFIALGLRKGFRAMQILRHGTLTHGRLIDRQRTATKVNNKRVYRLIFEYEDGLGRKFTTTVKTHETDKLEDEEQERLIYLQHSPGKAVMVDDLPGSPLVTEGRTIVSASALKSFGLTLLPLLGSGMMVLFVYLMVAP
jgi:uncharacterized membrane protein